ncbi:glutathione S-transferase family protein [Variovorax sp. J22G40]|uniref:glutathione S-transferase family protein n=2 Tax=unclassified Variovorax TaxID=663243 RepID=UPI00257654AD|nr:glutathione S-transferase family protein [Variovorax sp. J22G40]
MTSDPMRLFTGPLSMFGAKAEIAALEKGLAFERVMVPFDRDDRYAPRHPEVLRINPKQQVPVLIHGAVEIFDSTQIFEYFEDLQPHPALWPSDAAARAQARKLEHLADEVFFPNVVQLFGLQEAMQSAPAIAACAACARHYEAMEGLLAEQEHLAGGYSYADIALYMAHVFADRKGAGMTDATPRLVAWRERVGQRMAVRQVVGPMMRFLASQGRPVPRFLRSHLSA